MAGARNNFVIGAGSHLCAFGWVNTKTQNPKTKREMNEKQLEDFFDKATVRIKAASLPGSSITSEDIRALILRAQTETPGYEGLRESIRGQTQTASADRMDQAARETYARLMIEATCKKVLTVTPRELDDSALQEFFALCKVAVKTDNVQKHLRHGTPLYGVASSGKFPQDRIVQVQKWCLESLGLDSEEAADLLRERFLVGDTSGDPLELSFDEMVKEVRGVLHDVSDRIIAEDSNDGTTRVVSVKHSERIIDAETGEEVTVNLGVEPAPTTEQIHAESNDHSSALLAKTSQLQRQMREDLLAMSEGERNDLLDRANRTADEVLNEVMAIESIHDRVRYLASIDPGRQKLMALKKVWEAIEAIPPPASELQSNE